MNSVIFKGVIVVVIVGILLAGTVFLFTRKEKHMKPESIVAFGDSLMYGIGSTKGNDFVTLLSEKIGMPIVNMGIPGDTTADGVRRVDEALTIKPGVVILLLGGNDALQNVSTTETFNNLRILIEKFESEGAKVLLLGVRGRGVVQDPYKTFFEELAKEKGVALVPNVLSGLLGDSKYMSDAVHPNDEGYAKIAEKVLPHLIKLLQE